MTAHDTILRQQTEARERVQRALRHHVRDELPYWMCVYLSDNDLFDDVVSHRLEMMPADEREQLEAELEREIEAHQDTPPPIERPR